jgi:isopentenyl-diphosphate delta-isomerase
VPVIDGRVEMVEERVVLLAPSGEPVGTRLKSEVHGTSTPLHLAFSLYLFDADDRLLLTRRALDKRTWPGVWTNTCCGHPSPDESMTDAVTRRLEAELGLEVTSLACVLPDFGYRAVDASGVVENEYCPVFSARVHPAAAVRANASEVMDWRWAAWDDLTQAVRLAPFAFSPWAAEQVPLLPRAA